MQAEQTEYEAAPCIMQAQSKNTHFYKEMCLKSCLDHLNIICTLFGKQDFNIEHWTCDRFEDILDLLERTAPLCNAYICSPHTILQMSILNKINKLN